MPRGIDKEVRQKIVFLRALDYDKQDIADEVGISRNTVRRHLNEVREDVESSDAPELRLATIILEESQFPTYLLEQAADSLSGLERSFSNALQSRNEEADKNN